jgi:TIR domain
MEDEAIKLFFSYSHKDEILRNELVNHLRILTREGVIASWDDRKVLPGDEWDHQIHAQLQAADIVLLLISVDFIASDYCNDVEVRIALQRHAEGDVCVIPIILRAVDWTRAPFSKLQALPTNGKPITNYVDRDEAFLDVAQGIRQVAETMRAQRKQKWEDKQNALNQYKQKVEEILSSSRGHISVIARDTLQELCAALRMTPEEAQDIETRAFKPYHEYEDKLKRYEQTLRKVLAQQPLSEETKQDLQYRQRDLGIKPEDVARIEQLLLAEGASLYQEEAQTLQSQEAERARQQDLPAQRTREEMAQARERAWEAQRAQEELRAAQDEAQRQQEAARAQQPERQQQRDTKVHPTLHDDAQPSHAARLSSSKTRLWVGGSMMTIVFALAFVFFLSSRFRSTDTASNPVSVPQAQGANAGAPAPSDPDTSITTAPLIAEGTTVSGSLIPGQDRHFFQLEREKLQKGSAPTGAQVALGVDAPPPASPPPARQSSGSESAPPAVTVELRSPTPGVTFRPQQRFQTIPGKKVKIAAAKQGYLTAEKTIIVAEHNMAEELGPLQPQAAGKQGERERRKPQAEETERRRREAEQTAGDHQRQAEETKRPRREAEEAEPRQRETRLVAQGMKFIVKRVTLCVTTTKSVVTGTVTRTGASSVSCEDAKRLLVAEDEKKNACLAPETQEGIKQWIGTESWVVYEGTMEISTLMG